MANAAKVSVKMALAVNELSIDAKSVRFTWLVRRTRIVYEQKNAKNDRQHHAERLAVCVLGALHPFGGHYGLFEKGRGWRCRGVWLPDAYCHVKLNGSLRAY